MTELGNRPLLATARDQRLAVERPEVDAVVDLVRRGLNVLLVGDRGSGKTSALHAVAFLLREEGRRTALVDAGPAAGVPEAVAAIAAAVAGEADEGALVREARRGNRSETSVALDTIRSLRGLDEEVCVLVDELRPGVAHPLFGRLRDELWQTPLRFVASATPGDAAAILQPPADVFFEATVRLEPLGPAAQEELLRRRLDAVEAGRVLPALRGADLGNPRALLAAAREALAGRTAEGGLAAAVRARARRVAALGPAAERMLAELDRLGAASASDARLLEPLGWSRQRAAQVGRALEEAGLVSSGAARGDDGRVRRVFAPVPASALVADDEEAPAS
jgi:energy-coupling factor transporter ATP-binding protein EcfA2